MGGGEGNLCRGGACSRPHPARGMCVAYVIGRWPAPLLRWPGIWQVFYIAREGPRRTCGPEGVELCLAGV